MNVRDLKKLGMENLSNGGRAILDAVGPSYEYRNGQKTDKVNGLKVTVVFPANRYAKHTITVADPVDRLTAVLDTTPAGNEICVTFQNVTVKIYRDHDGKEQLSVKAESVKILEADVLEVE